jgi:hypothetical protein
MLLITLENEKFRLILFIFLKKNALNLTFKNDRPFLHINLDVTLNKFCFMNAVKIAFLFGDHFFERCDPCVSRQSLVSNVLKQPQAPF